MEQKNVGLKQKRMIPCDTEKGINCESKLIRKIWNLSMLLNTSLIAKQRNALQPNQIQHGKEPDKWLYYN